jgi:hypothetical protein
MDDDKAVLTWVRNAFGVLIEEGKPRIEEQKENLRMYKGALLNKSKTTSNQRNLNEQDLTQQRVKDQKLYVNLLYDVTEQRVSKLMRFKPAVSILPTKSEQEDRIAAKVAKNILDTIWYDNNIDEIVRDMERHAAVLGESYVAVLWDADKGDLHPDYVAQRDAGEAVVIKKEGNEEVEVTTPIRVGDIAFDIKLPWRVLNDRADKYEDCYYQVVIEYKDIDLLRSQFPEKAANLKDIGSADIPGYDDDQIKELKMRNQTIVIKVYHKKCKYMPEGAYITATLDAVLTKADYPFNFEGLPYLRLTDMDVPGELNGVSFYRNVKGLQFQHYNLSSMIIANQRLCAYPKWMVPEGTVNAQSLGNDRTIVQYRGPQAPRLEQSNPTPAEVFNFRETLKEEIRQLSGGNVEDRGQPPAGITAAVALQFLAEQESERFGTAIAKHNKLIQELAQRTLSVAGDNYDPSDGRMMRIMGKSGQYDARFFDVANLNRPYNVRVANSSALPESKSAKTQTIIDLSAQFPGLFTNEQVADMLDLGASDKFYDIATLALRAAESIYEDLVQGRPVLEPQDYENLILHWKVIVGSMQDRAFKEQVPEPNQEAVKDYVRALEMLMEQKRVQNPLFNQELSALALYPVLFVPAPPLMPSVMDGGVPAPAPMDGGGAGLPPPMAEGMPQGDVVEESASLPNPLSPPAMNVPPMPQPGNAAGGEMP